MKEELCEMMVEIRRMGDGSSVGFVSGCAEDDL